MSAQPRSGQDGEIYQHAQRRALQPAEGHMQAGAIVLRLHRLNVAQCFAIWQRPVIGAEKFEGGSGVFCGGGSAVMPVLTGADVEIEHGLAQGTDFRQRIDGGGFIGSDVEEAMQIFEQTLRIPCHDDFAGICPIEPYALDELCLRGTRHELIP